MASEYRRRASVSNRIGMIVVALVVGIVVAALFLDSLRIRHRISTYTESISAIESLIREEEFRAKEIENLPLYLASDSYVEKVAREKLGLVYADEVIFIPES